LSGSGRYFYPAPRTAFYFFRIITGRIFTIVPVIRNRRFGRGGYQSGRLLLNINRRIRRYDHDWRIINSRRIGGPVKTAGRITITVRPIIRSAGIRIRPPVAEASVNPDIAAGVIVIAVRSESTCQAHTQGKISFA